MNSFNTNDDTRKILRKYGTTNLEILTFNQVCIYCNFFLCVFSHFLALRHHYIHTLQGSLKQLTLNLSLPSQFYVAASLFGFVFCSSFVPIMIGYCSLFVFNNQVFCLIFFEILIRKTRPITDTLI